MPADAARLLALAFDPDVLTADDAISHRILDAALALAAASGLRNLTMDDVARRAAVGRMTVYRRFGARNALIDALAVRECRRCLAAIADAIDPTPNAGERMAALLTATLTVIREHPLLSRLASFEPEALLLELTRDDGAVFRLAREFLVGLILEGQAAGELIRGDAALLAELGLRLGASFVLMPESVLPLDDEQRVRGLIAPLLVLWGCGGVAAGAAAGAAAGSVAGPARRRAGLCAAIRTVRAMRIRHAEPGRDGAECAAVYAPYVRETVISFEEQPPSGTEFEQRIERITRTHPWLVASDEGQVVGFAYGSPHHERAAYRWSADVAVYVAASHHGRGVGRALYEALLTLLTRQGLCVACAGVTLPNVASVALHESFGFTPVGVYRGIGFKFGAWHDVGWWQLQLASGDGRPPAPPGPPQRLEGAGGG